MNVLVEVKGSISICSINGKDYPVARLDEDYIAITAANEKTANNIALMTNGEKHPTSSRYSPFEIWVGRDRFDRVICLNGWRELAERI